MSSEHSVSMASEREKALQAQAELTSRFDKAKREMEQAHVTRVSTIYYFVQYIVLIITGKLY